MISKNSQEQSAGDNSTNIQADTININGVTIDQARQIALDVYRSNALELAGIARDTATARAEQITERFIKELSEKNPAALQSASDPDFQHAVFEAQKAFARAGDKDLEDVLVNLLTSRATEPVRNLKQIVLNEAISVASKLTSTQINTITLLFRFRHTVRHGLLTIQNLANLITTEILPFFEGMPETNATYSYLAFTGVATVELSEINFLGLIRNEYPGICSKGIDEVTVLQIISEDSRTANLFIKLPDDAPDKFHLIVSTPVLLGNILDSSGINNPEIISKIKGLLQSNPMSNQEVEDQLFAINPKIKDLKERWDKCSAKQTVLTPVGMAIGHANATKHGTLNAALDIWVN